MWTWSLELHLVSGCRPSGICANSYNDFLNHVVHVATYPGWGLQLIFRSKVRISETDGGRNVGLSVSETSDLQLSLEFLLMMESETGPSGSISSC